MNYFGKYRLICPVIFLLFCITQTPAQTGGTFEIKQSVIASGGGQQSAGGTFALDGTIGQSLAGGFVQNAPFSAYNGFWTPETFAPTATTVSASGRVLTADGRGIRNAFVTVTDSGGNQRTTVTGKFGIYHFTNLPAGETYIISVRARRFSFNQPTLVRTITEDLMGIDFTANESSQEFFDFK